MIFKKLLQIWIEQTVDKLIQDTTQIQMLKHILDILYLLLNAFETNMKNTQFSHQYRDKIYKLIQESSKYFIKCIPLTTNKDTALQLSANVSLISFVSFIQMDNKTKIVLQLKELFESKVIITHKRFI